MDEKIKEQILAIRETALTNMFDIQQVKCLACERDYDELVVFIEREHNAVNFRQRSEVYSLWERRPKLNGYKYTEL